MMCAMKDIVLATDMDEIDVFNNERKTANYLVVIPERLFWKMKELGTIEDYQHLAVVQRDVKYTHGKT